MTTLQLIQDLYTKPHQPLHVKQFDEEQLVTVVTVTDASVCTVAQLLPKEKISIFKE